MVESAPPPAFHAPPLPVQLSEIALTGVYEISKILTAPNRLEATLSSVVNVLSSFMQMRHGVISLLADDGVPDIIVGLGWSEGADERYRARLPERAIGQVIATSVPLVAQNVASHPMFSVDDAAALGATDNATVSFIGVPIRAESKVIGTLTIDRVWDGQSVFRFDADVRFLSMIANLIGQTVQLHRVVSRDRERLMEESHRLQKQLLELKPGRDKKQARVAGIVGDSPAIRSLIEKIAIVAKSLTVERECEKTSFQGDPEKLRVVVDNLLSNAIKYSPVGGTIVIRLGRYKDNAVIEVIDSGPGIPDEDRDRVFDPFYRGKNATHPGAKGTGLGLAIVRDYVEMHRGSVKALAGSGAHFRVILPKGGSA